MFVYMVGILFSTAVLAIPNGRTEVTYPSLETLRSGVKIVKLRSFGRDIELKLEPAGDVIADDFTIVDGKGKIQKSDVNKMKRRLFRDKEKGAALYVNEEGPSEIKGILTYGLKIDPYESQDMVKDGIKAHRITEVVIENKPFYDEVINLKSKKSFSDNVRSINEDQCVEIEYLFVTDNTLTNGFEDSDSLISYMQTIFVNVQDILETLKFNINIRLIGVQMFTDETEPSFIQESQIPGKDILHYHYIAQNLSNYYYLQDKDELVKRADIIMFFSRRVIGDPKPDGTIFTGILGAGYLGKACDSYYKTGITLDLGDYANTAITFGHETGHILGSPHDGEGKEYSLSGAPGSTKCPGSDGFLMGGASGHNRKKFSACSRENIEFFLNTPEAHCLITDCMKTF